MTPPRDRPYRLRTGPDRRRAFVVGTRGRGSKFRVLYRFEEPRRQRPTMYRHPFTSTREATVERFRERFEEVSRE